MTPDQSLGNEAGHMPETESSIPAFLRPLIVVAIGAVVGLLVAEVAFRVAGIGWPVINGYLRDEQVGNVLRPNAEFEWTKEGHAFVKINSRGLRDDEHQIPKPDGTWRFAVLGDSMAEALQVDPEDTFWSEMERDLRDCPALAGMEVEAVNFGVSGHGTAQELITLRTRVWDYEPDMVVLAITNSNDIRNNSPELEPESFRPFFLRVDDELVLDNSFRAILAESTQLNDRPRWQLAIIYSLDRLRVGQLAIEVGRQTRNRFRTAESGHPVAFQPSFDNQVLAPPANQAWIDAWWVTEQLVAELHREVTARGVLFDSLMIPSGIQVDFDEEKRLEFADSLGVADLSYPERRMESFANANGIPFFPLMEPFMAYSTRTSEYLFGFENAILGDGHMNELGHRRAGDLMAARICDQLAVQS
jgi:hypothetical protein